MSLAAPWALLALAALPLAWWLHRRRHRPRVFDVPSLLFLLDEEEVPPARRQLLDAELWWALLAILFVVLAAAGPRVLRTPPGRTIRVVVSGGAPAAARGYAGRVSRAVQSIQDGLRAGDDLVLVHEPPGDRAPRPAPGDLLAVARAGRASARFVIADRPRPADAADLRWVAVGDPGASNLGLIAASLEPYGDGVQAFVNVQADAPGPTQARIQLTTRAPNGGVDAWTAELDLPARGHRGLPFPVPRVGAEVVLTLLAADGSPLDDDLPADDEVRFGRRPLKIGWDEGLPTASRTTVEQVLRAALGDDAFGEGGLEGGTIDLVVTTRGAAILDGDVWRLVLAPILEGEGRLAPWGPDVAFSDPAVRDLTTSGVELRYAPGAETLPSGATLLLGRAVSGGIWPVVARRGRTLFFLPDPERGAPAPARSPLWPLFVDNVLHEAVGTPTNTSWGYRLQGLLDAPSSALGREASEPELAGLPALRPDRSATYVALWPWLAGAALLCCLLLWAAPRIRRARRRKLSPVPSSS